MTRRTPTPSEISRFAQDAVDTMLDRCIVLRFTEGSQDARGLPGVTYTPGKPTVCCFSRRTRRETMGGAQVPIEISALRLPLSEAVTNLDRILLTHRMGRQLAEPITFEISDLRPGIAQHVLDLKPAADPGNVRA